MIFKVGKMYTLVRKGNLSEMIGMVVTCTTVGTGFGSTLGTIVWSNPNNPLEHLWKKGEMKIFMYDPTEEWEELSDEESLLYSGS